jgi:hypothetical protein
MFLCTIPDLRRVHRTAKWQRSDKFSDGIFAVIDGMNVPIIYESRCHTCRHRERAWIERMMIRGMPFVWIANTLNGIEGGNMRTRSLSRHYERHLAPVMTRLEARLLHEAELRAMLKSRLS